MATEPSRPPELYQEIAPLYHLIYEDWEQSVAHQGDVLDALVCEALGAGPHAILDASCGIGTQALGLAALGHHVTASDRCGASVARARDEARARGLAIDFDVRDMRECERGREASFDAVVSADNSVPHLQTRDEVLAAFRAFRRALRPGGVLIVSLRDYGNEDLRDRQLRPHGIRDDASGRTIVFQTWDIDRDHYDVTVYFVREGHDGECSVQRGRSRYWAVPVETLAELLRESGFDDVERIDGRFFQPVLRGRRSAE